ncbi:MAG: hypothetical protein ACI3Y5_00555, partial [Prevotella sp.]
KTMCQSRITKTIINPLKSMGGRAELVRALLRCSQPSTKSMAAFNFVEYRLRLGNMSKLYFTHLARYFSIAQAS